MKLAEITLENVLPLKNHRIGRLSDGVNIIEGHPGSGKSAIRDFIRDVIIGNHRFVNSSNSNYRSTFVAPSGQLSVKHGNREYNLQRNWDNGQLLATPNTAGPLNDFDAVGKYLSAVSAEVYETVYSFSLKQTSEGLSRLARVINGKLGIPIGSAAAGEDDSFRIRARDQEVRKARLFELRQQIDRLKNRRLECLRTLEQDDADRQSRLLELDREIQLVSNQLQHQDLNSRKNQLSSLEREIAELRAFIEDTIRREGANQPSQLKSNLPDPYQLLYLRLDEIDSQIRRWRRVQNDVQSQRVRLKDEMVVWGELNLDSAEHPYHNARKVLIALEDRINQTDQQAKQWELAPTHHTDPSQSVRAIQGLCQSMRHDLQLLSNELGLQYKNIRHRAAALELKQLRHCYNVISENIERLVRRREQVINEVRFIDAPGAEAIVRSEASFIQCALHEGYLEARRRFVGPLSAVESSHAWVRTDLTEPKNRLQSLQAEANQAQRWIIDFESRQSGLKSQYNHLVSERTGLAAAGRGLNSNELIHLDAELQRLTVEHNELARAIESEGNYVVHEANSILAQAAQYLQQLTGGEWNRVWLAEPANGNFVVLSRNGQTKAAPFLDPATQHLVYLAMAFAAQRGFIAQGIDLPTVIDDVSVDFSREQMAHVMRFLNGLQRDGLQLLLLTEHNYFGADTGNFARFHLPTENEKSYAPIVARSQYVEPLVETRVETVYTPVAPVNYYPISKPSFTAPDVLNHWVDSGDIDPVTLKQRVSLPSTIDRAYTANLLPVQTATHSLYPTQTSTYPPTESFESKRPVVNDNDFLVSYVPQASVPQRTMRPFPSTTATPTSVEAVVDPMGFAAAFDDSTELDRVDLLDPPRLRALSEVGIETIAQLLELTPEDLPAGLRERGISADQVDRWQAIVWMLTIIPGLRVEDAKILVACGVTEPEHLATSHPQQLLERIQRFVSSAEGQRFVPHSPSMNLARINGWLRALQTSRARWQQSSGFSRHARRRSRNSAMRPSANRSSDRTEYAPVHVPRPEPVQREASPRHENVVAAYPIRNDLRPERELRQPFVARPPRMQTPEPTNRPKSEFAPDRSRRVEREPIPIVRERPALEVAPRAAVERQETALNGDSKLRFYLDLKDHIEAAPSIGPKTAERFERIGVRTVEDFIKQTAESMTAKLKYQRITADMIRAWQHQTRLVCRIPNLRGHDAQLLVACNLVEPEKIAGMQPQRLLDIILPFARSKEGLKIVRTGKEPDLQEVSDWIRWAGMTRSIHAA